MVLGSQSVTGKFAIILCLPKFPVSIGTLRWYHGAQFQFIVSGLILYLCLVHHYVISSYAGNFGKLYSFNN